VHAHSIEQALGEKFNVDRNTDTAFFILPENWRGAA
jgi:hypothetical protein